MNQIEKIIFPLMSAVLLLGNIYGQSVNTIVRPVIEDPNPCVRNDKPFKFYTAFNNTVPPILKTSAKGHSPEIYGIAPKDLFVSVFVMPNLGPIGEAYTPDDFGKLVKIKDDQFKSPFIYPSVFF